MKELSIKDFINKVLAGVALGIVAGLVPNAILGELFKFLANYHEIFATMQMIVASIQFTVPVIVGVLIAHQFNFNPLQMVSVGGASFAGSGAAQLIDGKWMLVGIGDLINTMITATFAVLIIYAMRDHVKSLAIILVPTVAGGLAGFLGYILLPYVKLITSAIGNMINSFTTLQPLVMCLLIAAVFSIIIVSPVSTVAIAYAIGISGLASGAANLGIAAAAIVLAIGSYYVNEKGVTIAILLGGMKMLMPNLLKHPIMILPLTITGAVTGVAGRYLSIQGTPASGGFGFSGLVGPINAYKFLEGSPAANLITLVVVYFIIPTITGFITHYIFTKVFKLYTFDIFKFEAE
ncbi:PTS transporter subunit IIC [Atopobacter phocae]|uniref:PTS transporter subunit IIC n=1 Tax=Atopobacter phocae TaxID=136492 RepID=UPI0004B619BB|nr:PTS sugar transporter subunit IIC [Atopobacter phocae]